VLQYTITQEQHSYSTNDDNDDDCDYVDGNGLLTGRLNSLKASSHMTGNPIGIRNTDWIHELY
jgi:hypothetical protein